MDWKQILSDLIASGMTQVEIASHIGLTQSAIAQVLGAKEDKPRGFKYEPGVKLVQLHQSRIGNAEAACPGI